ncbi:4-hydroxy-tetrahydrodipicolinate synthase [Methanocella sp. CWC-04]|uniref:4-hydroxy-tetrahydrodipicolinate synthase n=1 Tax=Methanooceanicella nereidis TaxID=2052831 RepID=A0AAP2W607_9EURY|nr:4-hydroxy-tetrahydrodipicolinate synthase [Methanocella sp. CWC-04]MCD1296175.1 4-hydroxy-tetrahydrodipicolinate synthase [Methanocella sp. CWC-04]
MYHPGGVYPAIPVPFKKNGDLDGESLIGLIQHFEDTDINGILIMGTSGEFAMMNDNERRKVVDIAVGSVNRLETIINAGYASTRETVSLAKYIKDAGGDAAIVVAPYFYHPSQKGMADHFVTVAEKADIPVLAYNIPSFSGNTLSPDIMTDFALEERIVGIKDSGGDPAALQEFIHRSYEGFSVMVGSDSLACFGLCMGAAGMIIGSAAIAPWICTEMYDALRKTDFKRALSMQLALNHVIKAMSVGTFPVSIKYCLRAQGLPAGYVRKPLEELSAAQKKEVEVHLKAANILK